MPAPTKSKVSLTDAEPELAVVAKDTVTEVKEVATEVADAVKTDAATDVTTAVKAAEEVVTGTETAAQAEKSVETEVAKTVADAEAPVKAAVETVTEAQVEHVVDTAEHDALKLGEAAVEARLPFTAPLIEALEPEIETVVFHVTNVVTSDFIHKAETFVVELVESEVAKLHITDIRQKIASKIEAELATGERIVANALNVVKLDARAIFIPHEG